MPKVAVLSLGGTIAMGAKSETGGVTPSLTAEDLISTVPGLSEAADLEAIQICNLPSPQISIRELSLVISEINALEERGFDGVVITQGTDTIEETSWVLDLCSHTSLAVVVTGAMRNPTQPGADGPANLLSAVQVAACEIAKGVGTLVVFNDQIHAARFVQKTHTSNVAAFTSPTCGPVGWMTEGTPIIPFHFPKMDSFGFPSNPKIPKISIIKPGLNEDRTLIDAAVSAGLDGIVLEASGGGHTSSIIADSVEHAAKKIPVILSSRTRAGSVLTSTYGFVGSEIDLLSRGLISSGYLDACKARILLMLSLMCGEGQQKLTERFIELNAGYVRRG